MATGTPIYATQAQVQALLAQLVQALTGQASDPTGMAQQLQLRLGLMALSLLKGAFVVKAKGGTDAAGLSWAPLKRTTVAYSRRHPGLAKKKAQAASPRRPLLTKAQDALWRQTFVRMLRAFKGDKAHAAAYAWVVVKAAGGRTILAEYGDTPVEVGRDTGVLLNSLSPTGSGPGPGGVLRTGPGAVVVGTNVPYARWFHAKRPLWPAGRDWPPEWRRALQEVYLSGVAQAAPAWFAALKAG